MTISVDQARARITGAFSPLAAEQVGLEGALGRVLAEDLASRRSQPPVAVSAMDGYAVRAEDVTNAPVTLKVIGEAPAGAEFIGKIGAGEAVRIFTGGPVPDGADAIVIQENTDLGAEAVAVKETVKPGAYIREAGLDFKEHDVLLRQGRVMTARDVGLAAAMNRPWLTVRRKPRVAILATGDEVVMPGEPLGPNQIASSNAVALAALVSADGGVPFNLGIAPDDAGAIGALAEGARGMDLLITTGGASVGDHDLVKKALDDHGLELDFWGIAMKPGKPLMFGRLGATPMLGLPGNPVSALVCAVLFVRPALAVMLGIDRAEETVKSARLGKEVRMNGAREEYMRATLTQNDAGELLAIPFDAQDSAMLATLAGADCLIKRPPHAPAAMIGERVEIIPLAGGIVGI
ncbi:MAG: molybdopterin molybdotransferase MoeA [Alphaproteobacteria bacterium]|nr:molybdopterin molybdotransferase MoeA [Alphaproteobacteria bacterium]